MDGPCSGGTQIILNGTYLDVGNNVKVFLGSFSCIIEKRTRTSIVCMTTKNDRGCNKEKIDRRKRRRRQVLASIRVFFDGVQIGDVPQQAFTYHTDPTINSVFSYKYSIDTQTFERYVC